MKCSIFYVPVIPGLCPSVPRGWGRLGQMTRGCNLRSSAKIVHWGKSLTYWFYTQQHWWSVRRLSSTWMEYLGSKRKVYEKCPSLPWFPLDIKPIHSSIQSLFNFIVIVYCNFTYHLVLDIVRSSSFSHPSPMISIILNS